MGRRKKAEEEVSEAAEVAEETPEIETEGEAAEVSEAPEGEAEPEGVFEAEASNEAFDEGDPIKVVQDEMLLRVEIGDHELVEKSREMIEALDEAKAARARLKSYSADCKAQEEEAMQRFEEAKALVRSGKEDRRVPVEQIHNWARVKVYTRRLDTGEIIGEREMNSWERQMPIEGTESGDDAAQADEASDATDENAEGAATEATECEAVA